MKSACLAAYENQVWSEVHTYDNYTLDIPEDDKPVDQHIVEFEADEHEK